MQERVTKEACGCSTLKPTTPNPTPSKLHLQNSLARGRRRASNDNAALNPIDARVSPHGLPGQANRGSTGGGRGSTGGGAAVEAEENGGRSGAAPGRQLDSIVDDARAEVKLLARRGTHEDDGDMRFVSPFSERSASRLHDYVEEKTAICPSLLK